MNLWKRSAVSKAGGKADRTAGDGGRGAFIRGLSAVVEARLSTGRQIHRPPTAARVSSQRRLGHGQIHRSPNERGRHPLKRSDM